MTDPPFRPILPNDGEEYPAGMIDLMKDCWENSPENRPSFGEIKRRIRRLNKKRLV